MVSLIFLFQTGSPSVQPDFPAYLKPIKLYLENRQFEDYLNLFSPELRQQERENLIEHFETDGLDSVSIFFAGQSSEAGNQSRAFFQVVFQNDYSALIEVWQISYRLEASGLIITDRRVSRSSSRLYRLRFPGKGNFLVKDLSLTQKDLTINFSQAEVFLDNLPEINTALIIIGRGQVKFEPSDEIEKNQLRQRFKKPYFEAEISSLYVRGSTGFFQANLKYEIVARSQKPAERQAETDLAASIFARNYPRSFTVENSITGELLTFLPQSDETVIEIQAGRKGEFTYVYTPFAEEEIIFLDRRQSRLLNSYSPAGEEPGLKRMFVRFEEKYKIESYQLEASYVPANHLMSARAGLTLLSVIDELDGLQLRLNPELQIRQIIDDQNRQLYYTRDRLRKFLYVYLAEKSSKGQRVNLNIFYEGQIMPPPPQSDVLTSQGLGQYYSEPRVIRDSYLFTSSSDWYPAPATEKYFTFDLKLYVPDDYYALASGQLVAKQPLTGQPDWSGQAWPGSYVYIYQGRRPVKYLSFLAGHFKPERKMTGRVGLEYLAAKDGPAKNGALLEEAGKILEFYQNLFGDFPYEQLSIVQRFWPASGGVSPPGYVVLNEEPDSQGPGKLRVRADNPVDLSYWPGYYLAHEIAHQWWGHGLTYGTYRDNWLTEGLSQFSAILYLQQKYGQKAGEEMQKKISKWVSKKSGLGPVTLGLRLSHLDFTGYQAIVYDKAALALFMLKDLLGEELFYQSLKTFYQKNLFKPVRTSDFRLALERASGQDLRQFFHDWFDSEALPDVEIKKKISRDNDQTRLELSVRQLKKPVLFPLVIILKTDQDSLVRILRIENQEQVFELQIPGQLKVIEINPGHRVPGHFKLK